ncbi:MAG: LacI family DNA-binding transcriptional regulator [Chthoniobacteraceae bacterium]|nr:LacI family DNA-binding transcriptional regulator [Chthoniobacteraceae bacterium]
MQKGLLLEVGGGYRVLALRKLKVEGTCLEFQTSPMTRTSKVTLNEIARKTGVTRMAVSLALRGKEGVSDSTRKKILKVATQLGYQPDPEVSKLMTRIRARSPATKASLALLTFGPSAEARRSSLTERKYVEGCYARAKEYGYRIEEVSVGEDMSVARAGDILWSRGIEGVIVRPLQVNLSAKESRSILFNFERFSAVAISETLLAPDLDRAIHDQYTAMLGVILELSKLNYQKIGLGLEEDLDLRVNGRWTAAYQWCQLRSGTKRLTPPLVMADSKQSTFDRWFDRHRPDIIVSVNRFGLQFMEARGLDIPGDIGYASLDVDGDISCYAGVSGIDQNSHLVGAAAVDLLVGALQRGQRGVPETPMRLAVGGVWRVGESAVKQSAAKS